MFGLSAVNVSAAGLVPCGTSGTSPCTTCDIFKLIKNIIDFLLVDLVPAVAILFVVIAGVFMFLGGITPSNFEKGKKILKDTVIGLFIVFGAWVITTTILKSVAGDSNIFDNWFSIQCTTEGFGPPPAAPAGVPPSAGACSLTPIAPITDQAALAIENGTRVVWTSANSNVQANLAKLQQEFNKLNNLVRSLGGSATVNSAYRPLAYQAHLYNIYQSSKQYSASPATYDGNSACSSVISALKSEQQNHGVCNGSGSCLAASPNGCAPHVKGTGIDISLSPAGLLDSINAKLQSANIDLRWQALPNDPVHFNLINPPFSGCAQSFLSPRSIIGQR